MALRIACHWELWEGHGVTCSSSSQREKAPSGICLWSCLLPSGHFAEGAICRAINGNEVPAGVKRHGESGEWSRGCSYFSCPLQGLMKPVHPLNLTAPGNVRCHLEDLVSLSAFLCANTSHWRRNCHHMMLSLLLISGFCRIFRNNFGFNC